MQKLTMDDIKKMAELDVKNVDSSLFTNIDDIEIDVKSSVEEKLVQMLNQSKNIYVTNIEGYVVKVKFQKNGPTIDEKMTEFLKKMAEIYY